jgi:transglutaminase-like putative cysteine protease
MRLRVRHETTYCYDAPVLRTTELIRMTPSPHEGQRVITWDVRAAPGRQALPCFVDGFGNVVHAHSVTHPHREVTITACGEVETRAMEGLLRGAAEPFPPSLFLRTTPLSSADEAITAFAWDTAGSKPALAALDALMARLHERITYRVGMTDVETTAAAAFARGFGVCQDHAHIFIAAARALGIPARYVGGYLWTGARDEPHAAGHAWAEAFLPDLGWIGFDASNGTRPTEAYIRASVGLDYLSAAPVRGVRQGNANETMRVRVTITAYDQ